MTARSSRRQFLRHAGAAGVGLSLSRPTAAASRQPRPPAGGTFLDLHRAPDAVIVQAAGADRRLQPAGGEWRSDGIIVTTEPSGSALRIRLSAPAAVTRLHLRWRGDLRATRLVLGDAWERGYGDFEWRGIVPDRVMPWYFAACDGQVTHGYGVRTRPNALCFWRLDDDGISLFADVRSGGAGVLLGARVLDVCEIVCRQGRSGESPFAALHALCLAMCPAPKPLAHAVYGSNDWYWAYGKNSAASFLDDARRIVELAPADANRPFAVVDDGWQPQREDKSQSGLWDRGNVNFGDMAAVADRVRGAGARPGVWIRPLLAPANAPDAWRLPRDRAFLDPTVPDALRKVSDDIARLVGWGFALVKHDYTSFDLFGRWGFQMGATPARDGWTFAAGPARTTAEVIGALYDAIRTAAGGAAIIGCNTVGHLSAGLFEISRIGDDTSGTEWERVPRMGVNALAFRGLQHGAFHVADADCVGVTEAIPWALNRQWLDLVSRSGTALFVSLAPGAVGPAQTRDLRAALARAARPQPLGEPLDWQHVTWPSRWRFGGDEQRYDWLGPDGA